MLPCLSVCDIQRCVNNITTKKWIFFFLNRSSEKRLDGFLTGCMIQGVAWEQMFEALCSTGGDEEQEDGSKCTR